MIDLDEWTKEEAKENERRAHDAGLSSERNYYAGRQAMFAVAARDVETAAKLLDNNLTLTGARGARFVAGMRDARRMIDGARAILDRIALDNAGAFQEPTP